MALVVIYDACVLYPAPQRDLLIRLARAGLFRARWTDQILDECFRNILANRPDLQAGALVRTRELMIRAIPDCMVRGYEPLIDGLRLPDPDDRHVLAAAIRAAAQTIVTANLSDFPASVLKTYGIEAVHPDDFIVDLIDLAPGAVASTVKDQVSSLKNPPRTLPDVLDTLRNQGLVRSVAKLREILGASAG